MNHLVRKQNLKNLEIYFFAQLSLPVQQKDPYERINMFMVRPGDRT